MKPAMLRGKISENYLKYSWMASDNAGNFEWNFLSNFGLTFICWKIFKFIIDFGTNLRNPLEESTSVLLGERVLDCMKFNLLNSLE